MLAVLSIQPELCSTIHTYTHHTITPNVCIAPERTAATRLSQLRCSATAHLAHFTAMPSVPAAVLLLVLSAARWQATHQQPFDTSSTQPTGQSSFPTDDLSTTAALTNDSSVTATASELLGSALVNLLALSSSLLHSLPAAIDSLEDRLSSLSSSLSSAGTVIAPVSGSTSAPHDRTVAVLWFLLVSLSVALVLLSCVTLGAWQRYAADIAEFKADWHSTRARRKEKKAEKRHNGAADDRHSSSDRANVDRPTHTVPAAADAIGGRQSSEHLYGFISRARAISEADDDVEMTTPTVVVPGRDPFSQLKRRY